MPVDNTPVWLCVCNLPIILECVYVGAFLHACVWRNKWVIKLHQGCLPSHNKCTQIFGTLQHQPPTLAHTHAHSSSQCDELSVPVRLGILVSTRFRSPFRGAELRTFPPQHFQRALDASAGRKAANMKERGQTGSESQRALMISESLYLIICWNSFHSAWVLQFLVFSHSFRAHFHFLLN